MKVAVLLGAVCILQQFGNGFGANPNYSFHVKVDDPGHSNFREKAETRKLEDTQGFYRSSFGNKLSTGSVQVSYAFGNHVPVAVPPANGGPSVVGVYAPAYVFDSRGQLVDKSVAAYAAPPPVLNVNALQLPGPAVVVPQPLRQVAPVIKASAALTTNYAPAFVPPPQAFAPLQVAAPPQVVSYVPPPPPPPPPAQVFAYAPPPPPPAQVFAYAPPPPQIQVQVQPAPIAVAKVRPAKYLTVPALAPAVKVVKARPAIVKDSYAEPPRDTFRDPNAPSYPDAVKIREPTLEYGPPSYVPPPPLVEEQVKVVAQPPPVKVVQQQVAVALPPPPPPPQAIAVQQVVAAPQPQPTLGLYAGAIGFHTHTAQPDAYVHAYGTQGFQVTTSRKFNKAVYAVPQQVVQPQPVYGPPPAIAVQKVVQAPTYLPPPPPAVAVQPAPLYGPPPVRVVQPKPVYGPPPAINYVQQAAVAVAPPPPSPPPVVQTFIQSAPPPPPPPPAPIAVSAPILQQGGPAPPSLAFTGKKQNPLTFTYSYDQGGAKVTHSYAGSGW